MATSVWAKAGAGSWALDAEENEAELEKQQQTQQHQAPAADFPSLSAAVSSKKKKGQTLSLAEFATYTEPKGNTFQPSFQSKGLTHVDMSALPTGPRERTAEEMENSRLGGGFRSYGGGGGRDRNVGDDSSNSRWGSNSRGGGDETRRSGGGFGRDSGMEFAPSRADEIDNWAQGKKSGFGGGGFDRRERGGGERGGGFFDSQSKADDSDSWVSKKSFVPAGGRGFGVDGGGFERERRGGFDRRDRGGERGGSGGGFYDSQSKADDSGNWMSAKSFVHTEGRSFGGSFERERRGVFEPHNRGGPDLETWGKNRVEVSVVENRSISSSRPRLNLQPRTLPVSDVAQLAPAVVAKPKGANPFGAARPREVVLAEKGQDWKKIDEQLNSMKIKDTALTAGDADATVKKIHDDVTDRSMPEIRVERGWWKPSSVYARPQSAEKVESTKNGVSEENEP